MSATVDKKVFSRWSFCTKSQVLRSQMCPNLCKWQSLNTMMMIVKYDENGVGDDDEKYHDQHQHFISEQKDVKLSLRSPGLLAVDTDEEKDKER